MIINEGVYDVLKTSWITDSIKLGRKAPLSKKCVVLNSSLRFE